jgi:RES domain-containing protein
MTEEDEILICTNCVKDIRYKKLIRQINNRNRCTCCGSQGFVIDADSNEFVQMTKALIRYHYSEWDYNEHWGGNGYGSLFYENDNIFLEKKNFNNDDVYEELINRIECFEVYEDFSKGVSIFAGYWEGQQNPLLQAIKSTLDHSIVKVEDKLKNENYFKYEDQITTVLTEYSDACNLALAKGMEFFRARVGYKHKKRSLFAGGFEGEMVFVPYTNSEISAPPPHSAGFGRVNRAGVSFLYCATDTYTAISEIRPHPGDIVSVGRFVLCQELRVFDLTEEQFLKYYMTDEKLNEFSKLNTLTELMQRVIPPSERQAYSLTQLIADCVRKMGFDGIMFPSSVGDGENLVVFDPAKLEYTYKGSEVIEVEAVKYGYDKREWRKEISEIE